MSLFDKDMLSSDETVIKNENALNFEFVPKMLPFREAQQKYIANCIKPLLQERNGKNLLVYGKPGIGKTAAIKWVFRDLEEETDDVIPVYINCWQANTSYKMMISICEQIGYTFTQNKRSEELFTVIQQKLNKKAAVFAFDEIDKAEELDLIYSILEGIYRKTILMITNYKESFLDIDERIKSRLTPDSVEFKTYTKNETIEILKQRADYALYPNVLEKDAFEIIADKAFSVGDIRSGIYLIREAALAAEDRSSKKIIIEDVKKAISKLDEFKIKSSDELEQGTKILLETVKENSGQKSGDLYKIYKKRGGDGTYKTFQRRVEKLAKNKFISLEKISGGAEGTTSIITYAREKKLDEF